MNTQQINNQQKTFNQLNPSKDISNYFVPKKNVNKKFTNDSYQIRIFEKYISIPKKFCFLDKNKQNFLIGIKSNYVYNVYDAEKNWREKLTGHELIKKYNLKGFHFLTVEKQRFANMQKANPFLMQFKNAQESMEWHRKQKEQEQKQLKAFLSSRKKNTDTEVSENDIVNKFNSDYEQKKYQSTEHKKRSIDINQLLIELDDPIFN